MAHLFISTLKGVTFEWFIKLHAGSIKTWANLKKLFLTHFFEDDTEVAMLTLLATKQKIGESIKAFVERFQSMTLCCPSDMYQSTLVETCHHNLQTALLARIGVAECHTWKQLVQQGEQAEEIIARVSTKEKNSKPRLDISTRCYPKSSSQPKDETL